MGAEGPHFSGVWSPMEGTGAPCNLGFSSEHTWHCSWARGGEGCMLILIRQSHQAELFRLYWSPGWGNIQCDLERFPWKCSKLKVLSFEECSFHFPIKHPKMHDF